MSDGYASALGASRLLLRVARVFNLFVAAAFATMLLASFLFEPAFRDYFTRQAPHHPDMVLTVMRLWVVVSMPMYASVHILLTRLLAMVETVRSGDPFVPDNAARLKTIAWCLLVVQLFGLACGLFIGILKGAGTDIGDWDPSLSGWIAVLLLFVLARVFEEGARIRADLEAMV